MKWWQVILTLIVGVLIGFFAAPYAELPSNYVPVDEYCHQDGVEELAEDYLEMFHLAIDPSEAFILYVDLVEGTEFVEDFDSYVEIVYTDGSTEVIFVSDILFDLENGLCYYYEDDLG